MKRYCSFLSATVVFVAVACGASADETPDILLWPDGAPGAVGTTPEDQPALFVHQADPERATGAAVIVCPGGGYRNLMMSYEGHDVAQWFNSFGVTAFVLRYRLAPRYQHPAPLDDAQRAIRVVRARADRYGLRSDRIGIMGFSAGGHLASTAGTLFTPGDADASDPVEQVSSRPDFMILCYAVIALDGPQAHVALRDRLLGENCTDELARLLSSNLQVTPRTPPAFLLQTDADPVVPAEHSVLFYLSLREAKVPGELHVYQPGPHGVGLDRHPVTATWPELAKNWMRENGWLEQAR